MEEANGSSGTTHKLVQVPQGWSPFARAKHAHVVERDAEGALSWLWIAIREGDRVDSAVKDMVVLMKQLGRAEQAIHVLHSLRHLCSQRANHSLDNLLLDLYKKSGRMDEHIELIKQKLRMIYQGDAFHGKPTRRARSHGKKFQVSIQQEISRLLANMGWAYMQKRNFMAAEVVYKKSQLFNPDANKACNLSICLIKQARYAEAFRVLEDVNRRLLMDSYDPKPIHKAKELIVQLKSEHGQFLEECMTNSWDHEELKNNLKVYDYPSSNLNSNFDIEDLDHLLRKWAPYPSKRLPIFEDISSLS